MASTVVFLSLLLLTCSTFMPSKSHSINSTNDGFSISIIHRDSPESPLYNHSMTPHETRIAQLRRSISRVKYLSLRARAASQSQTQANKPPEYSTRIFYDSSEFIASYYIGDPRTQVHAFIDTGSDIIWSNVNSPKGFSCLKSKTYQRLLCNSPHCQNLGRRKTCQNGSLPCTYEQEYADKAKTSGVLSRDKFWFDVPGQRLPQEVGVLNFGCSSEATGFDGEEINGCLGLDRGHFSFITQLGIKRFSHCLPKLETRFKGAMHFGSKAVIHKDLAPFVQSASIRKSFYYVSLQGISIGNTKVEIPPGTFDIARDGGGGFIVDCGTTFTSLATKAFDPFLKVMRQSMPKSEVPDPDPGEKLELCFEGTQQVWNSRPPVTFHFERGVDVKLSNDRIFVKSRVGNAFCLAIVRSHDAMSVFGSLQMANFIVGFDLERNGVSFIEADCSASSSGGA